MQKHKKQHQWLTGWLEQCSGEKKQKQQSTKNGAHTISKPKNYQQPLTGWPGNTRQPPQSQGQHQATSTEWPWWNMQGGKTLLVKNLKWQQQSTSRQTTQTKRQQSTDLWLQQQLCCYKQPPHPWPWHLCGGKKNLVSKKIKWKTNKINLWQST